MKASDYIVEYLIEKGIKHVFGYPGGMVTHLMDSFGKYEDKIKSHVTYHEQGAAFAACGYAQASGKVGVAYATSGPGATNLITGICNAYFDSIPTLFITGQVNTFESKGNMGVRQRGFQETDIVSMISGVTKLAVKITDANDIKFYLDKAFSVAQSGRKGPVLLDIPMNIFRAEIKPEELKDFADGTNKNFEEELVQIKEALLEARKPVLLLGNGVKIAGCVDRLRLLVDKLHIPVVTSMLAVDVIPSSGLNFGFIGAYGSRSANFIVAKCDLLISIGARLDVRQVGAKREMLAPNAKIIRCDIDAGELEYKIRDNEISICADASNIINYLFSIIDGFNINYSEWETVCFTIKHLLSGIDDRLPNKYVKAIGEILPDDCIITTDVGQNQVWVAQSLNIKSNQKVYFSGGHGAMGYSLPAAIGCSLATGKRVYSFNGDGGLQMNIQELQTIVRENLPITIFLFNNYALGMIRHFQEMYFDDKYVQTMADGGYTVPDFEKISYAYGIEYSKIKNIEDIGKAIIETKGVKLVEIAIPEKTYVYPKLEFGKPNQDQEPLLDRNLYEKLMKLGEENMSEQIFGGGYELIPNY